MYLKYFKFISFVFLFTVVLLPQNLFAQSNSDQIINRYVRGELLQPTAEEKQIIGDYLDRMQPSKSVSLIRQYSPDAIIYSEDFTGQVLPTGWSNIDNGITGQVWEFNNPGARTITGSFDSDFAILDSDNYGSGTTQDATLTTVAIDASSETTVILGFDIQYRHLTGSSLIIEASNDSSTWTQVDSIVADVGYPNPAAYTEYDISAIAAGQSTVYVRWTYVGGFDWWAAIDNVVVYEPDPTPNPAVVVSPSNGGTDIDINATLNWSAGGGSAPTGYRINFGTDNPPTNIENNTDLGLVTTYTPGSALAYSTTYYWEIIPYNGVGDATGTIVWSFTTMADPTISIFPWNDDLENPGAPGTPVGWTQDTADDIDWTFDSGGTGSTGTGPSIDQNPGTSAGTYGYTEATGPSAGDIANISSPPLDLSGLTNPVLSFWYHMYGAAMGTLNVDYSTDGGSTWTNGFTLSGDQGDVWYNAEFALPTDADYVRFSGVIGSSFTSDMAFDDVTIYDGVSPPNCAVNVSPPDGEDSVSVFTDLNWADGGGGTEGYLIYFGTDNPPTNIENGTDLGNVTSYVPSTTLITATTYYWQIIAYNVNGNATSCAVWSFTTYPDAPLSGTYTVGLTEFINKTGKKVYFEKRTRTVTKNINGVDASEDINTVDSETKTEILNPDLSPIYVEVTETYMEMMENGKPFDRNFYLESPDGIYPTLTEAINDVNARGVSGPVTFSLVDTYYPTETYPILIGEVGGASATNTITIKPATGIQTEIPGDPAQPSSTLQLGYADYIVIDGSNAPGGTTKDLKIQGLNASPAVHLYGDASNNVIKNIVAESNNASTGSGAMIFGAGPFDSDNNVFQNCTVKPIDTVATRNGVGIYFFSSNTGDGNQILDCTIYDFDDYGLRLQGAPTSNTLVSGCEVYMTDDASTGLSYGAYVSRVEGLIIEKSKFYNLHGSTVRGIYLAGNSTSGDFVIRNNFIALGATTNTSGLLSGLDYFGYAANSLEAYNNSIYLGTSGVTGSSTTYALTKRDDADVYKVYNNAVYNARSNGGGTGSHYAVYFSDTNTVTLEWDYNSYFADGSGGVFGYYLGDDIVDLTAWKDSTGLDANGVSGNPGFTSAIDLHVIPAFNTLDGNAMYFASVPDDIDGDTRNMATPDIGADEYTYVPPSVSDPTDVTATAISESQIDVGFTPNGSTDNVVIVFNLDGIFTTPSGTPPAPGNPFAGGTLIANTTTSPYSHTSLTNATTYYYKLWSYDGVNYSIGVTANATTPFGTISTFPYAENFENGGSIPAGWEQDPAQLEDWFFDTDITYAAPSDHTTGTGYMAVIDDSSPYDAIPATLISPPFDITGLATPALSFFYWIGAGNAGPSTIHVDVYNGSTWTDDVITALVENSQWDEVVIDLTPYQSSGTKVRFRGFENTAYFDCDLSLDDVSVFDNTLPPSCAVNVSPADSATDVLVDADLNWNSGGGGPTGYLLYFGTDGGGVTPPTNLVNGTDLGNVAIYDHPADLSYSTTYYWQVIAYNGNGQSSGCDIWEFTTQADPTIVSFPWNDDLENPGTPGIPLSWTQDTGDDFDWTFDAGGTTSTGTGPSVDHNPGTSLGTYGYTEATGPAAGDIANILTPPFDLSGLSNPVFSFWYHMYGAAMGTLNVDYSTDGGSTWINGWSESGDHGDVWLFADLGLPTDANYVRFSGTIGSSFTSDMAFDDVTIYDNTNPPNCAVNVSPSDGEDSVSIFTGLDWTGGGGAPTGYKLFFGTDNPPTNIVNGDDLGNVTDYLPAAILTNGTTYYWQVVPYNPIGDATGCAVWSFTTNPDAPLAGDYTVGLTEFNRITGKNIYFEQVISKVMTEVDVEVPVEKGTNPDETSFKPKTESKLMEVEEISWIAMENGEPYTGDLYVYKESSPQDNFPEGTDGVYTTLTAAVADLNARGVSGAVNFLLTDASYTVGETYPLVLDFGNTSSSTVTIKPNTGVTALVQGSSPSGQIFMILSSNVTIDGSNAGGTDRSLTLENTSTVSPQVVAIGSIGDVPITDVTLKNSVVINGAQTSSAVVISDGVAPGSPGYFNDITVQNNHIQKAYIGAYCNAVVATGNGSGLLLTENNLDSAGTQAIRLVGLYVQGVDGATLSHNNIANFDGATSEDDKGIWLATGNTNATVEKNYIHSLKYTGTGGYGAQGIVVSSITLNANILIKNNMIYDISGDGWGVTIPGDNPYGIYIFGSIAQSGIKIYHNSINLFGNTLSSTNAISAGIAIGTNSSGELQDNIIVNNLGVDDLGVGSIGVWLQSDSTQLETSNYNDIFVNATGSGVNYVGQIATTGYADLAGWQTGSGADANSISADPGFISNTDLHIDTTSTTVSGKGIYLASVPMDIDGDTRMNPPDIGADEYEGSSATFSLTVSVGNGWNMVSAPGLHPVNQDVTTWWSGKDPAAGVFKYSGGYVEVFTTTPSEGYWLKNVGAQVYNHPAIQIVPHNDVPLALGWNLFGLYEVTEPTATLQTSPAGIITTPIFEYSGGYNPATDIVPGYGYWAKADAAGSIVNLSAPPLGKKGGEVVEFFKEDWGKIVLTDASGINYTLYAVTGEVDLDKYELPPMPPAGMFDIRYGSGRIAEDINSSLQEIQLTGVTYPLTVKVEGMDIRVMDETGKTVNANLRDGEDVVISDAQISKLMVSGELLPTVYALEQNYPNPFNPSTTIEFSLPEDVKNVKLSIYNVLGEKVAELVNTSLIAGKYQYQWNGTSIASGMYIYELRTDKFVSVKKMMLLK